MWTISAFLVGIMAIIGTAVYQYERSWTPLERYWFPSYLKMQFMGWLGFKTSDYRLLEVEDRKGQKRLATAGYDISAFQQLVKSTDMPAGTCAMCLSTPPTGAALGNDAFTSQEMLDHTMEEELRHLGQNLSIQEFGPGSAAAKEAEVNDNRKFPEPK